jgi:hypothetical protein
MIFRAMGSLWVALFCRLKQRPENDEKNCVERKNLSIEPFSALAIMRHLVAEPGVIATRFACGLCRPQTGAFNV